MITQWGRGEKGGGGNHASPHSRHDYIHKVENRLVYPLSISEHKAISRYTHSRQEKKKRQMSNQLDDENSSDGSSPKEIKRKGEKEMETSHDPFKWERLSVRVRLCRETINSLLAPVDRQHTHTHTHMLVMICTDLQTHAGTNISALLNNEYKIERERERRWTICLMISAILILQDAVKRCLSIGKILRIAFLCGRRRFLCRSF